MIETIEEQMEKIRLYCIKKKIRTKVNAYFKNKNEVVSYNWKLE